MKISAISLPLLGTLAATTHLSFAADAPNTSNNAFNPAISLILDGRYTDIDNSELSLPGFQLGGEASLPESGFSTGHNELVMSASIDDRFYGFMSVPIIYQDGETSIELEEAFVETLGLGGGLTVKGGKFFSGLGYLNAVHDHAHDFADRPLVYDAMFGGHLGDTGVQVRWVAPTEFYLNIGAELTRGSEYPGGENDKNNSGKSLFVKTGGDIGISSSWQLGASYYASEFDVREAGGHHHGGEDDSPDNELVDGEVDIAGVDFVYKWAPNGNAKNQSVKFQGEYFVREESGYSEFSEGEASAQASYDGKQYGFYVQSVYQFLPAWRVGVRYDALKANNSISHFQDNGIDEQEYLDESSLGTDGDRPTRYSIMADYSPTHFSRLRLQFSSLEAGHETNDIVTLQYIMSLGSHGAHSY